MTAIDGVKCRLDAHDRLISTLIADRELFSQNSENAIGCSPGKQGPVEDRLKLRPKTLFLHVALTSSSCRPLAI